jgi:rhodanese-related sulfurtransferase
MPITIDREEVQRLARDGALLLEVLPAAEYEEAHLPGAVHLPLKKLDRPSAEPLDRSRPIITYCWDHQ